MTDPSTSRAAAEAALSELDDWLDRAAGVVDAPDLLDDADRADLVRLLITLDRATKFCSDLARTIGADLAALMEADVEQHAGRRITRSRSLRTQWNGPGWRSAVVDRAVERLAVNPETGEVFGPLRRAVTEATRLAFSTITPSTSPSAPALTALDINPAEYRSTDHGPWTVKITKATDDE